jgi:hypothetical protein
MRPILRFAPVLLLSAILCGCGSSNPGDSDPPPGVRLNENRNNSFDASKKGKPWLIDQKK